MSGACSVPVGDAESECEKEEVAEIEPAEEKKAELVAGAE